MLALQTCVTTLALLNGLLWRLYQSILCPVNILEWPRLKTVAQGVVYALSSRVAPNEISTLSDPFTQWDTVFHLFFFNNPDLPRAAFPYYFSCV